MSRSIVWFRNDLRVVDNAALRYAAQHSSEVVCVFVAEEGTEPALGGASRWWLHHALADLAAELNKLGVPLVLRSGRARVVVPELVKEVGATAVYWNRRYDPSGTKVDQSLKRALKASGATAVSFKGNLLFEPHELETGSGGPYKVFTPFWRACSKREFSAPVPSVRRLPVGTTKIKSLELAELKLLPTLDWDASFYEAWQPTRREGLKLLQRFKRRVTAYSEDRDRPDRAGTSRVSPYLRFGQLSPREIAAKFSRAEVGADKYLAELGWREFAHHLLFHFPHTVTEPLRPEFAGFPWQEDAQLLRAWQRGLTGYPIVDAGMRELWATGWMHNRVRMIVASFLVKHLLQPWQRGAEWFWDTLVDADLASNTLGWQWSAGSGADAAPYFRIFNPVTQGKRFDSEGSYVRRWLPELGGVPAKFIHEPSAAPASELAAMGVVLGAGYPVPIVGLRVGRERALGAYQQLKEQARGDR